MDYHLSIFLYNESDIFISLLPLNNYYIEYNAFLYNEYGEIEFLMYPFVNVL